jgi:hypothetical protein
MPGATLALTTNLQGHMREFYDVFAEVLGDDQRLREHVEHRATVASVKTLLTDGGFTITRVVEKTGTMRFADGSAMLNHHFIKLGFLDAWKQLAPERAIFAKLRDALDAIAREEGELRLTIPMAYVEARAV